MSQLPPPPPGADDSIPPPPSDEVAAPSAPEAPAQAPAPVDIPPPAPTGEQYEADLLKRKKTFSWKTFGGDGFLVSVAVHVLLLILGLFWIISKYVPEEKKPDPEVFATGAGGGQKGEKAKSFEHKLKSRQVNLVKSPSRIVSKSANASVTLPSTPATNTASFASGLSAGGMSKGSGGGSGGGEGTGIGIGKGGGRNFVSLFGAKGLGSTGLPGTFYDLKQFADGKPTPMASGEGAYFEFLRTFVKSWDTRMLSRYFKSEQSLNAAHIFIRMISSSEAPAAFEVADRVKPTNWLVVYEGKVIAPFTGTLRLWGIGDQFLFVNWDRANVLDSGYFLATVPPPGNGRGYTKPVLGTEDVLNQGVHFTDNPAKVPYRASRWFEVVKGREYEIKIAIGDTGGVTSAHLLWEKQVPTTRGKGDGVMRVFRMSPDSLPEAIRTPVTHRGKSYKNGGADIDVEFDSPIWYVKQTRRVIR